eukprot:c41235_g1_i1 orf=65-268(+)
MKALGIQTNMPWQAQYKCNTVRHLPLGTIPIEGYFVNDEEDALLPMLDLFFVGAQVTISDCTHSLSN